MPDETDNQQPTPKVYTESEFAATQAQMRAAREEAKGHRLARDNEATARAAAEAALVAAQAETAQKLTAIETRYLKAELKAAAIAAGINDPTDSLAMIALTDVVRDDDGNPTNAADLMAALKEAKPYLFTSQASPRSTSQPNPAPRAPAPAVKLAKDMTDEEYKAARAALIR